MTPQTAAALRALVTEIRAYGNSVGEPNTFAYWADRLATVLTQEGAGKVETGIPLSHSCVFEQFAPAEPRAAEGAGMVCTCGCGVRVTPTAAAAVPAGEDAGPIAHVLIKDGEAIGIACNVAQNIPDGVYPFYKETCTLAPKEK